MIPRSKSAPKPLDESATPRLSSRPKPRVSRTALTSPAATPLASPQREIPEDPFSLSGFFPAETLARGEEWDWIRSSETHEEDANVYPDFSQPWTAEDSISKGQEGTYDEFAEQVIDGEDKFGMLAFSSENIPSLLRSKMPVFERPISPVHVSPLVVDEPLDLDALHVKLCSRRETEAVAEPGEGEIGKLFFTGDEEKKEDESRWTKLLYLRVMSLVGGFSRGA